MTKTLQHMTLAFAILTLATFAPAQVYTDIHDFQETDGCCANYPSTMVQGQDGNIYGATTSGGAHLAGNIFMMTPAGVLTSIFSFDGTHGNGPQSGISMGTDGNFYGTTYLGGSHGFGTIFKVTPGGGFTELYDFANTTDGAYPRVPPVQAADGNLYGLTGNGTAQILYKLTTAGVFSIMATLPSQSFSPLILGTDNNLYGTTLNGGTFNGGTVFQYSTATKALKVIFNFHTEFSPHGPLLQGSDGALYGTCSSGGTGSGGALFRVTTGGVYKVLVNFVASSVNGSNPFAGVVQGSDKFLYGVASTGGANGLGVLFKVSTSGTGYSVLHSFETASGDTPLSTPLLHTNGTIYGMASHGGAKTAYGMVYSLTNNLKPFVLPVVLHAGRVNSSVQILGQGFDNATGVQFGTGTGTFTIGGDTFMTAKIGSTATTGLVTVKEPTGNLSSQLTFKITPAVTSFTPTSGPVGTSVTITGQAFTGATAVKFGTVAATFTVNSATKITATVPTGAVTAKISVTTPGGTATSTTSFTVQ